MSLAKRSMGALEQSFLEFQEQPAKSFSYLQTVVKSNVKTKCADEENQIFLHINDPTAPRRFY